MSQVRLTGSGGGNTILNGNDTITADQTFEFPDNGGTLLTGSQTETGSGGSSGSAKIVGYQQGTWTPTALQGVSVTSGFIWERIGNLVTIRGTMANIATGNAGAFIVEGLPYPTTGVSCGGACMSQGFNNPPTTTYVVNTTQISFFRSATAGWVQASYGDLSSVGALYFECSYRTSNTDWAPENSATVS